MKSAGLGRRCANALRAEKGFFCVRERFLNASFLPTSALAGAYGTVCKIIFSVFFLFKNCRIFNFGKGACRTIKY